MHTTRNDLPQKTRARIEKLLNARLAEALDLAAQVKQAHWNVKGPNFIGLHELFDKVAEEIEGHSDEIAERAVQLGAQVHGTIRAAAKASSLKEYPLDIVSGADHVDALSDALAAFGKLAREAIDTAGDAGDADTADLFTQVSRSIDKSLWMIEAHGQSKK